MLIFIVTFFLYMHIKKSNTDIPQNIFPAAMDTKDSTANKHNIM